MNCKYCGRKAKSNLHYSKCGKYNKHCNKILTKEVLKDMYVNKKMSVIEIANHFNLISQSRIYSKMKEFNISRRSFKDMNKVSDNKRRKTNLEKYGHEHNFCRDHPSRIKMHKKMMKNEGISNVFQRPEVIKKIKKTFLEKYQKESPAKVHRSRGDRSYSSIHKKIVKLCQKLKIDISIEYKIKKDSDNRYYAYDIYLENSKKLIEVYGDYWHGNPRKYKSTDLILKGSSKEITVKTKWNFDLKKNKFCIEKGYSLLIIWESDTKNEEYLKNLLLDYSSNKQSSPIFSSSTLL